jgi:nucleoside-diphosphate-sugar epimerase
VVTETPFDLRGARILVTGVTGAVAEPVARSLAAAGHDVVGAARFAEPARREALEAAGVRTAVFDLDGPRMEELPPDLDVVLHFAIARTNKFERDLTLNAEGVAFLVEHVAGVRAFLHCSSTAVYEPHGHERRAETDPLGDSHRPFGFMPTYSITKIAAESAARYACRRFGVPTVIARLGVPYGEGYGWMLFHLAMMEAGQPVPVHVRAPSQFSPIHHDDIMASLPYLLGAASVPATTVNWAGPEAVSIEDWSRELAGLTGLDPAFAPTGATLESIVADTSRLAGLGFEAAVGWREGLRRLVEHSRPDLLVAR